MLPSSTRFAIRTAVADLCRQSHEELLNDISLDEALEKLRGIKGYLTWFPQDFLIKENNAPTLLNPEFYIPLSVFI